MEAYNEYVPSAMEMDRGREIRNKLLFKKEARASKAVALENLERIENAKKQVRESAQLNAEKDKEIMIMKRKINKLREEKKALKMQTKLNEEYLASLEPSAEKQLMFEAEVQQDLMKKYDKEAKLLIQKYKVCQIRNLRELLLLQKMRMPCRPIIDMANVGLVKAAQQVDNTWDVLDVGGVNT